MDPSKDIADVHVRVSIRTAYKVVAGVVGFTIVLVAGWMSLKNDVAAAHAQFRSFDTRIGRMECLLEQQTNHQIYKRVPTRSCYQGDK